MNMTPEDTVFVASFAAGLFFLLFVIFFCEAEQQRSRAAKFDIQLTQAVARARAEHYRADLCRKSQEQSTDRANLLAAHVNELEKGTAILEQRVTYLTGLIQYADINALGRMAVMDGPLVWMPKERDDHPHSINLN